MEASYALRVEKDGMIIGGNTIEPGDEEGARTEIEILPGRIAVLSTKERLRMPHDLVGRLGVRINFASRGLAGQMGMQVDPYYGRDVTDGRRLYIKVANLGNKIVHIREGDTVFNMEFSTVEGAEPPSEPKPDTWQRQKQPWVDDDTLDWTYLTRIEVDLKEQSDSIDAKIDRGLDGIRHNQQSVVLFGVFLVAITILATMVVAIMNVNDTNSLVEDWGWKVLIGLCAISTLAIAGFLFFTAKVAWRALSVRDESENKDEGSDVT